MLNILLVINNLSYETGCFTTFVDDLIQTSTRSKSLFKLPYVKFVLKSLDLYFYENSRQKSCHSSI